MNLSYGNMPGMQKMNYSTDLLFVPLSQSSCHVLVTVDILCEVRCAANWQSITSQHYYITLQQIGSLLSPFKLKYMHCKHVFGLPFIVPWNFYCSCVVQFLKHLVLYLRYCFFAKVICCFCAITFVLMRTGLCKLNIVYNFKFHV